MPKKSITFPSLRGTIVVALSEDPARSGAGIYGDPAGLKSLGELLIAEAELDQTQFPAQNLPKGEPHHLHLLPGTHTHPQSIELILGRIDGKGTGKVGGWLQPAPQKRIRPIVENVSDE